MGAARHDRATSKPSTPTLLLAFAPTDIPRLPSPAFRDGQGRIRTGDTTIFSRVLYQLSYLAG